MRPLSPLLGQHRPITGSVHSWLGTRLSTVQPGTSLRRSPLGRPVDALHTCRHPSHYAIAGLQAVTQLTQLIALHLSRNHLKLLPEAVGSLKALQWLDLRRNAPPACSKCAAQPRSLESQPQEAKAVSLGSEPWQSTP